MATRKTQEKLAKSVQQDRARYVRDPESKFPPKAREDIAAALEAPPRDEHAEHLAMMEKLLAEVAQLRATLAGGFDKLVAAVLDAAVEEAAEMPQGGVMPVAAPEPPAEDPSKAGLKPASASATLEDVRRALNDYTRAHGLGEASKVVQKLGVKRLSELPAERYAEAVEALS